MIDEFRFGEIVIEGKAFHSDVIIFPDRVQDGWWRREGHRLLPEDLAEIVQEKPEVLIVGTGFSGLKVPLPTRRYVESLGIELIVIETERACSTFNALSQKERVIAALHLSC